MSSFLRLLLLLVIVTVTTCSANNAEPSQDVNDFLPEADDEVNEAELYVTKKLEGLKEAWKEVSVKITDQNKDEDAIAERINHSTSPPPTIISPTPTPTVAASTFKPNEIIDPPKPGTPNPVVLPPPAVVIPTGKAPVCGRRGTCYQWFKDELELFLDGFSRCDTLHEYRARKYCCVDASVN